MARKRMLDPNIWSSEDFSKLSMLARLIFIGLFSNADDEGRGKAKPIYLKSVIFPYDEGIRVTDIEKSLEEIAANMSITFYSNNDNDYYSLNNWFNWQKIDRATPSKIPPYHSNGYESPQNGDLERSTNARRGLDECSTNARRGLDTNKNKNKNKNIIITTTTTESENVVVVVDYYNLNIGNMSPAILADIESYLKNGFEVELLKSCIEKAVFVDKRNWGYIKGILKNLQASNIKTKEQFENQNHFNPKNTKAYNPSNDSYNIDELSDFLSNKTPKL